MCKGTSNVEFANKQELLLHVETVLFIWLPIDA